MDLDIKAGITTIVLFLLLSAGLTILRGYNQYKEARNLPFYAKRREKTRNAVSIFILAAILLFAALIVNSLAEPVVYRYYIPSPTASLTPTITQTPTITLTPTPTTPPTATPVPLFTPTPFLSVIISSQFTSETTPNPDTVFSPLTFAKNLDESYIPIEPGEIFNTPINTMYASFSYDKMLRGAQWTALWFYEGELICYETLPWNGGSGGFGFSECAQEPDRWQPGNYSVQIFVGETWKQTGAFQVAGEEVTEEGNAEE